MSDKIASATKAATISGSSSSNVGNNYVIVTGSYQFRANQMYFLIFEAQLLRTLNQDTVYNINLNVSGVRHGNIRLQSFNQHPALVFVPYMSPTNSSRAVTVIARRATGSANFNVELPNIHVIPIPFVTQD